MKIFVIEAIRKTLSASGRRVLADAERPGAAGVDQLAVADHAPRDAGDLRLLPEPRQPGVDDRQPILERRHPAGLPRSGTWRGRASARAQSGACGTGASDAPRRTGRVVRPCGRR